LSFGEGIRQIAGVLGAFSGREDTPGLPGAPGASRQAEGAPHSDQMVIGRRESRRLDSRGSIESLSMEDKLDKVAQTGDVEAAVAGPFGDDGIRWTFDHTRLSSGHLSTRDLGATRPL